jgi:23S rRNA pseudouridine1911/1915/1917 synthase
MVTISMPIQIIVPLEKKDLRLDRFLAQELPDHSRSYLKKLIDDGKITCGDKPCRASMKVVVGSEIRVVIPPPESSQMIAQDIALSIVYEDEHLVVVNKAAGMVVHPAAGVKDGTLVNALIYRFPTIFNVGGVEKPGLVHRLDKDTSGLLVVAMHDLAYRGLIAQFAERTVDKVYLAIVRGIVNKSEGTIDKPIGRSIGDRKKMSTSSRKPRPALTFWQKAADLGPATLLAVRIKTGRTHQIRVHLASAGFPVVGDPTYGGKPTSKQIRRMALPPAMTSFPRQALHAWRLSLNHPDDDRRLTWEAPLPDDFRELIMAHDSDFDLEACLERIRDTF